LWCPKPQTLVFEAGKSQTRSSDSCIQPNISTDIDVPVWWRIIREKLITFFWWLLTKESDDFWSKKLMTFWPKKMITFRPKKVITFRPKKVITFNQRKW
jgi:hypothetical protein